MSFGRFADISTGETNLSTKHIHGEYIISDFIRNALTGLYIIIACVSVAGNVAIMTRMFWKKEPKRKANCHVTAVAMCDILITVSCVPFAVFGDVLNHQWIFGQFTCSAVSYIQKACIVQRSFIFVASALDRYQAIRWPLKKKTSRGVVVGVITSISIISWLLASPYAKWSQIIIQDDDNSSKSCREIWSNDESRRIYSISLLCITYFSPLFVLAVTCRRIILILGAKPPGEEYAGMVQKRRAIKRKAIKIFLLTFFAYAICWLPVNIITFTVDVIPHIADNETTHVLWLYAQCIAVSNSAISPVIVLSSEKKFKAQIQRYICFQNNKCKENIRLIYARIHPTNSHSKNRSSIIGRRRREQKQSFQQLMPSISQETSL